MASGDVAKKDITITDGNGRNVVVVAKGRPIPENLDEVKKKYGEVTRTATEEEIAAARGTEDKAKRSSRGK